MIILDMDGTLLNSNGMILESSKTILRRLKEMGKIIVIATGRYLPHAVKYLTEDFVDYILCNNGAVWYRMHDKKIIKEDCLDTSACINILNMYSTSISYLYLTDTSLHKFETVESAIQYINNCSHLICASIHLNQYKNCSKVVAELSEKYDNLYIQLMQDSFSEQQWIDIFCKDNNKGTNIRKFIEYMNVDFNDTVCFGDGLNDVEMFKNVKTSVAMKNALPELKQVSTHITDTNDNDGISKFLNTYFFKGE